MRHLQIGDVVQFPCWECDEGFIEGIGGREIACNFCVGGRTRVKVASVSQVELILDIIEDIRALRPAFDCYSSIKLRA